MLCCKPVSYVTEPAGCDCGFMSVERMRIVLGLDTVGDRNLYPVRQQITPDIRFNCDGLITKWIFGADWRGGNTYSELQVWRNIGNGVYHKVNSTSINVAARSPSRIYQYDTFSPIPVLAGDILGMFHSQLPYTQVAIYSEGESGPLTYNLAAFNTNVSTFDTIDLQNMPSLATERYHPLVTVEMSKLFIYIPKWFTDTCIILYTLSLPTVASSLTSSTSLLIMTSSLSPVSSNTKSEPVATPPVSATEFINALDASTTPPPPNTEASMNSLSLIVGVGVTGTLLLLIITVAIVITALVCLRKKTNKLNATDNVAYQSSTSEVNMLLNAAYATIGDHSPTSCDQEHVTAAAKGVGITTSNTVVRPPSAIYEVCNTPTSTNEITTSIDGVYYIMSTTSDGVYDIPTFTDGAYKITNPASNTTGAPASTNQA